MQIQLKFRSLVIIILIIILTISTACTSSKTLGTQRVSVANDESQANNRSKQPSISADGRYVAFTSEAANLVDKDLNGVMDVFVRDLVKKSTSRVSISSTGEEGNQSSYWPFISADGRYVTFTSDANDLVDTDSNSYGDVFLHDLKTGKTDLISVATDGKSGNDLSFWSSVSSDGRYVVFMSQATNLVASDTNASWDIFLRDMTTA